ncbi:MAG: hypothetical protein HBSIN02_17790 [Bacteroidia bacterium]|nr:MAG: hypothetical protein HBSIN02_17790 [Bacteroidia bacterium]
MARAWGCSSQEALAVYPVPTNIHSHSNFFTFSAGTNFNVGDIIIMGPANVRVEDLNASNGHAAYVADIQISNTPDGFLSKAPNATWRDDDPITSDSQVILEQVLSEGGGVVTSTLAQLKSWRPNDVVKGHYKVRKEALPYTITVQNSFSGGQIEVGRTTAGTYLNFVSPFTDKFRVNEVVRARAKSPQTVNGTTWTFNSQEGWWKNRAHFTSTDTMQDIVTQSATYEAKFITGYSGPVVVFQNSSDGVPIGSIIKVNGVDRRSPTDQFPLGATAEAYPQLLANRVQYQFQNWSTGSTSTSLHPSVQGTYTANYQFQYVLEPGNIYVTTTGANNNIKICWDQHPSPYVTGYQVWRKVNQLHGPMVIATLPSTATSYTDWEFFASEGYTQYVIEYDVRSRYVVPGVRDVYSPPFWFSVFGTDGEGGGGGGGGGGKGIQGAPKAETAELIEPQGHTNSVSIHPNPFNPSTLVTVTLAEESEVEMEVYDLQGRVVERLLSGRMTAGNHSVSWNAAGDLASGTYVVRLKAVPASGGVPVVMTKKLIFMK